MKHQTTALLLCALLFTTFGHELLNRHREAQAARLQHSPFRSHINNRDNGGDSDGQNECLRNCIKKCVKECPTTTEPPTTTETTTTSTEPVTDTNPPCSGPVNTNLTVIINVTTNILIVINETANVAIVFDFNAKLVLLVNVTADVVILVNFEKGTGIYYDNVGLNVTTAASLEVLLISITSLTNITVLVGSKTGTKFSIATISAKISLQISVVLVALGYQVAGTNQTAIAILVQISVTISVSWKVISQSGSSGKTQNSTDLAQLVGRLTVVASIITQIGLNVTISLDLTIIATANSGLEVLIYILGVIIRTGDQGAAAVRAYFQSTVAFFLTLSTLSANSSNSFSAFLIVIAKINALANKNATIDVIIQVLIDYYATRPSGSAIAAQLNVTISAVIEFLVQVNLTDTAVYIYLVSIQNGNCTVNSVDISAIITILIETSGAIAIDALVRILVILRVVIGIEIAIVTLLLILFRLLIIQGGIYILVILVPSIAAAITGDIFAVIAGILGRLNLLKLLTGDWLGVLRGVPIFGDIIVAIDTALKAATNGEVTVSIAVKSNSSGGIVVQIKAVIKLIFSFYLSINVGGGVSTREHLANEKHHAEHEGHYLAHEKHFNHHERQNAHEKQHQQQHERHHSNNHQERHHEVPLHEKQLHQHEKNLHEHNPHARHHVVSHGQEKHHEEAKEHTH